jgi:uncharacterized membrane protein YraQ (UPF0718 family)
LKKIGKRYRTFFIVLLAILILIIVDKELGIEALTITGDSIKEMLLVLPPIFVLLGLLDVWVPRETMTKHMGENSGVKGILLAIMIGSAAAGPLYGAFPVAAVFMKKGVKFRNVLIFIGAWSTTKIPMFLFEMTSLGKRFAISRLLIDIVGIVVLAFVLSHMVSKKEVEKIYENVKAVE